MDTHKTITKEVHEAWEDKVDEEEQCQCDCHFITVTGCNCDC